jgi:hypothetical protein
VIDYPSLLPTVNFVVFFSVFLFLFLVLGSAIEPGAFPFFLSFFPFSRSSQLDRQGKKMSPTLAQVGSGSAAKDVKRESATARLLGSGMAIRYILSIDRVLMIPHRFCGNC